MYRKDFRSTSYQTQPAGLLPRTRHTKGVVTSPESIVSFSLSLSACLMTSDLRLSPMRGSVKLLQNDSKFRCSPLPQGQKPGESFSNHHRRACRFGRLFGCCVVTSHTPSPPGARRLGKMEARGSGWTRHGPVPCL